MATTLAISMHWTVCWTDCFIYHVQWEPISRDYKGIYFLRDFGVERQSEKERKHRFLISIEMFLLTIDYSVLLFLFWEMWLIDWSDRKHNKQQQMLVKLVVY